MRARRLGHVEAVERNDATPLRFDPIKGRVLGAFGHGEDAAGIGLQQDLGRDVDQCRLAVGHMSRLAAGGRPLQGLLLNRAAGEELLEPVDIIIAVNDLGFARQGAEQRQCCFDAVDDEFIERAL